MAYISDQPNYPVATTLAEIEANKRRAAQGDNSTPLERDYAKGYDRGKEIFYDDPDMQDLRKRQEDLAKGYSGEELGAKRASARESMQGERSNYLKSLQGRVGRAGIGGARAAAMQGEADKGFQSSVNESERRMLSDDANLKRQGTQGLQDFIFRQKYGALGSAVNEQQMGLTERGKYMAQAQNNSGSSGPSWICTEMHKHERWNFGEMKALKKLSQHAMKTDRINAEIYFKDCGRLIQNMNARNYDFLRLKKGLLEIIDLIKVGKMERAYDQYKTMTISLVASYGV